MLLSSTRRGATLTLRVSLLTVGLAAATAVLAADAVPPGSSDDDRLVFGINKKLQKDIVDRAFPRMAVKWPFNRVFVCWEENDPGFERQRRLVRKAVRESWEAHSGLIFGTDEETQSWGFCQPGFGGVRIHVSDEGPHTKALGNELEGVPEGMVLNFTYQNWSPTCQTQADFCTRAIAVHEFGHAIGFAHEQNRPDTPGECAQPAQGPDGDLMLTPWDPRSVMNYCNEKYNNDGELSPFDITAVQYMYGAPK